MEQDEKEKEEKEEEEKKWSKRRFLIREGDLLGKLQFNDFWLQNSPYSLFVTAQTILKPNFILLKGKLVRHSKKN